MEWLNKFAVRIEEEWREWTSHAQLRESPEEWYARREKDMLSANPRFVLRQWVLEEVIAKVERDPISGRAILAKVLEASFRRDSMRAGC